MAADAEELHSAEIWRAMFDAADEALLLLDAEGRIVRANAHATELYGGQDDLTGIRLVGLLDATPDEVAGILESVAAGRHSRGRTRLRRSDDTVREIDYSVSPMVVADRHLVIARDVTDQVAFERLARQHERQYQAVFDGAPIGMALVSPTFLFQQVNPALCSMLGYTAEELMSLTFVDITHPDDVDADVSQADQLFAGAISSYRMDKRYLTKDGGEIWIQLTGSLVRDDDGSILSGLAIIENIQERKNLELHLRAETLRDSLTGLGNRLLFNDRLEHAVTRRPDGTAVAVAFLDLNGFKGLNDRHGHAAGDAVLRAVADRMRETLRVEDTVARIGGDEFAILLEGVSDPRLPAVVMSRLQSAIQEPIAIDADDTSVVISASIGLSVGDVGKATPAELLAEADRLMYERKRRVRR